MLGNRVRTPDGRSCAMVAEENEEGWCIRENNKTLDEGNEDGSG